MDDEELIEEHNRLLRIGYQETTNGRREAALEIARSRQAAYEEIASRGLDFEVPEVVP